MERIQDLTVVAPNQAVFVCRYDEGEPPAKVQWYKETREVYDSAKYDVRFDDEETSLTIRDTDVSDASEYMFEAGNKKGIVDTRARLTVFSKCQKCLFKNKYITILFTSICHLVFTK